MTVRLYINILYVMQKKESDYPDASILAAELRAQLSRLKRRLKEQADPGNLTSSQIGVILRLDMVGKATVSELSRLEGVRPQSMRNTVIALRDMGYIEGESDPEDGRKNFISLTKEGGNLLTEGRTVWNDWLSSAISVKLTPDEQLLLSKAVGLVQRLTEY